MKGLFIRFRTVQNRSESIQTNNEGLVNIQSLTANLGEDVHLPCKSYAENFSSISNLIEWSRSNESKPLLIRYNKFSEHFENKLESRFQLTEDGSLVISNVQDFDNGTYRCKVSLLNRSPESKDDYSYVDLQIIGLLRHRSLLENSLIFINFF